MKEKVSPAVAVALIVLVVIAVGFIGFKTLGGKKSSGAPPPEAQKWLNPGGSMNQNFRNGNAPR